MPRPSIASAETLPFIANPAPDQELPSHRARLVALMLVLVNAPPAYTVPELSTTRERTWRGAPFPKALQLVPFQRAMFVACNAAFVNAPPAYKFPAPSRANALIEPPTPDPKLDQFVPSHLATPPATAVPMTLKAPPI